jgi:hypothetical protein
MEQVFTNQPMARIAQPQVVCEFGLGTVDGGYDIFGLPDYIGAFALDAPMAEVKIGQHEGFQLRWTDGGILQQDLLFNPACVRDMGLRIKNH